MISMKTSMDYETIRGINSSVLLNWRLMLRFMKVLLDFVTLLEIAGQASLGIMPDTRHSSSSATLLDCASVN